jgi:hypothetical protein
MAGVFSQEPAGVRFEWGAVGAGLLAEARRESDFRGFRAYNGRA